MSEKKTAAQAMKELGEAWAELMRTIAAELEPVAKKINDIMERKGPMTTSEPVTASERLSQISLELRAMAETPREAQDVEIAHQTADAFLIEALRLTWDQERFAPEQIEAIISAWFDVPKWYA